MVLKIILAISLVGFLGFEIFNLITAIRRRRLAKQQKLAEQHQNDVDIEKSDKEVKS